MAMMPVLTSRMRRSSGVAVLLLDDPVHLPGVVAHDAPVAGRIGQFNGQNGQRILRGVQQPLQCFRPGQRHVAVEYQRLSHRPSSAVAPAARHARYPVAAPARPMKYRAHPAWRAQRRPRGHRPDTAFVATGGARYRSRARASALPASGCSTLGRLECMRLPCPAARMTIFILVPGKRTGVLAIFPSGEDDARHCFPLRALQAVR